VSCSVLFRQSPLDQIDALAPLVQQACGVPDFDARSKIRKGWGFLERNVTAEVARQIAEAVPGCVAIDNEQLRHLAKPRPMKAFTLTDDGFVPEAAGAALVPWADVAIVAAGGIAEEVMRRESESGSVPFGQVMLGMGIFMATGIPMGPLRGKKKETKPVKSNRWITFGSLITRQGDQFAMAFDHFNFAGLGAKKQLQTTANLRVLIGELQQRTPARLNLGARFVLAGKSLSLANYAGLADYETELLWLFNVPA
jgi:hypothetical protein